MPCVVIHARHKYLLLWLSRTTIIGRFATGETNSYKLNMLLWLSRTTIFGRFVADENNLSKVSHMLLWLSR